MQYLVDRYVLLLLGVLDEGLTHGVVLMCSCINSGA